MSSRGLEIVVFKIRTALMQLLKSTKNCDSVIIRHKKWTVYQSVFVCAHGTLEKVLLTVTSLEHVSNHTT